MSSPKSYLKTFIERFSSRLHRQHQYHDVQIIFSLLRTDFELHQSNASSMHQTLLISSRPARGSHAAFLTMKIKKPLPSFMLFDPRSRPRKECITLRTSSRTVYIVNYTEICEYPMATVLPIAVITTTLMCCESCLSVTITNFSHHERHSTRRQRLSKMDGYPSPHLTPSQKINLHHIHVRRILLNFWTQETAD